MTLDLCPSTRAAVDPDHAAIIMAGTGEVVTYGKLEARSCAESGSTRSPALALLALGSHPPVLPGRN